MKLFINPYKMASKSAKALSDALEAKRIKQEGSKFKPAEDKIVINWGCSKLPEDIASTCVVLNKPEAVARASNKIEAFNTLCQYVPVPPHTVSKVEAERWLKGKKNGINAVVERHKVSGHSGQGIKIKEDVDSLEQCPLYVAYIPKKSEYRVHVFKGEVIAIQRKARNRDIPDDRIDWKARNHCNGFIFARNEDQEIPYQRDLQTLAAQSISVLGLDFGAVDIIYNEKRNQYYVLEVNTACGLEGQTLTDYVNAINRYTEHMIGGKEAKYREVYSGRGKSRLKIDWEADGIQPTIPTAPTFAPQPVLRADTETFGMAAEFFQAVEEIHREQEND